MTETPGSMLVRPNALHRPGASVDAAAARDPWPSDDPVGEALRHIRMTGAFYCHSELTEPWGLTLPPMSDHLWFHAPARGRCWVETGADDARLVEAGGIALIPHGGGHRLRSGPGVPAPGILRLEREAVTARYERLRHGGGGEAAVLICGAVRLGGAAAPNLRQLLPRVLVAPRDAAPGAEAMQALLGLLGAEAEARRAGNEAVVTRLAETLVVLAIRAWIEGEGAEGEPTGWLAALRDPQIGRALALMHRQPEVAWTVGALARRVAMSRSAFASRFSERLGEPPMGYLARWRMHLAQTALQEQRVSIARVAESLGYRSQAAFSRAFKRIFGESPGAVKRGAAARAADTP